MPDGLQLEMLPQPDLTTCGPTCLHALYRYFGDSMTLAEVIREVPRLESGGTLAVLMANHALARGYAATIYTCDLQVFDPSWFTNDCPKPELRERLARRAELKPSVRLRAAAAGYCEFLRQRGTLRLTDFTTGLVRRHLRRGHPLLAGLSATHLYRCVRERAHDSQPDDVCGEPTGHFVVLCGYDKAQRRVRVADPLSPNPLANDHFYEMPIGRVISSVLLGILTYDANILVIEPKEAGKTSAHAGPSHRRRSGRLAVSHQQHPVGQGP